MLAFLLIAGETFYFSITSKLEEMENENIINKPKEILCVCKRHFLILSLTPLIAATIDLTNAEWNITGSDDGGGLWDGSTIHFESQVSNNQNYDLTGYFDWIGSGNQTGSFGRENFTGTLFSDNRIQIIGFEIEPPAQGIVFAAYSAELAPSGT